MQVYGFLLSSLCLGGAHCELPLLAHTTAPNHAPVIHHHVSWPFLKKVAVSSSSLDYWVWHVSVKSGIVSSSFFACSYSWLLSPCKYRETKVCYSEPWNHERRWSRASEWVCGALIWRMSEKDLFSFPKPSCGPLESLASPPCVYSAPGVFVWIKNC